MRYVRWLTLLVGWSAPAAFADEPSSAADWSRQGFNLLNFERQFDKAIDCFDKAIHLDPSLASAYCGRGTAYMDQEKFDKALADFNKAIDLDPKNAVFYEIRGEAYRKKGENGKALGDFSRCLELDNQFWAFKAAAYAGRAAVYAEMREYGKAVDDYSKAIQISPKNENYYFARGLVYGKLKEYGNAVGDYSQALEFDREWEPAYAGPDDLHMAEKDGYAQSIDDCSREIERDPTKASVYVIRGALRGERRDYAEAVDDFSKALERDPDAAAAIIDRAVVYEAMKDYVKAVGDFTKALKLDPKNPKLLTARGNALRAKREYANSLEDYRKAIEVDPKYGRAYHSLIWELATCPDAKVRNGDEAVKYTGNFNAVVNPDMFALEALAAAYAEVGNFKEAVKWQQDALDISLGYSDERIAKARNRLKLYQEGKPYHDD